MVSHSLVWNKRECRLVCRLVCRLMSFDVVCRGWTRELKSMRVGYPRIPAFAAPNTRVFRSSAPLSDFMYSLQI